MRHAHCAAYCDRRILPGQTVVWVAPGRWMHVRHAPRGLLRVVYHDDLDNPLVRQQIERVWREKGSPAPDDEVGRKRFDIAMIQQIADIRTRAKPPRKESA